MSKTSKRSSQTPDSFTDARPKRLIQKLMAENQRLRTQLAELGQKPAAVEAMADPLLSASPAEDLSVVFEQAKLDAMKELAYGASHEINNPLANIAGRAQTLLKQETDPAKQKALQSIHRQAMRAHEMISDLMLFARPPAIEKQATNVVESWQQIVGELQPLAEERGIEITHKASSVPVISVDPTQLAVALKALVENSIEAIAADGLVHAELTAASQDHQAGVRIVVTDTGPGMSPHVRQHLFDPFFSGREAGRGLGFGLSKCWRIVTGHGGTITADSPATGGARFTLWLPE